MTKIYRAGLIPVYVDDGKIHMLFMRPSDPYYGGPDFQIAKGKIELDESTVDAAIREASEELGLRKDNIEHIYECGVWLGRTTFFVGTVISKDDFGEFHFETGATIWMTLTDFMTTGRPIHRDIVKYAHKVITMHLGDTVSGPE